MRGFILAAGFGTRLKPITDEVPKALVQVCGEPLLAHNLRRLYRSGVFSAIGVNSHYLHEQMERFQEESEIPFELFYEKDKIRGTGGALDFARSFLSGDEAFLIANVDILHKFDIAELSARFMGAERICSLVSIPASNGCGTILYDNVTGDFLGTNADRRNGSLPPVPDERKSDADFTGVAFYKREFLDFVDDDDFSIVPIWQRAAVNGHTVGVLIPEKNASWWLDIGTHEALKRIHDDVDSGAVDLWN
ncbi:MAG: NTP transferase domain-containing protein [Chitinispirillales bacterium]|jgi:mannose-1-phosphate guanylyltransferase|nr:NTP transferase domain-containing protein [Chitinispirillales bacterium]